MRDGRPRNQGSRDGTDPLRGPVPNQPPPNPKARGGFTIPYRNLLRAAPTMGTRACGPAKRVLDERRFTPPNIEARYRGTIAAVKNADSDKERIIPTNSLVHSHAS